MAFFYGDGHCGALGADPSSRHQNTDSDLESHAQRCARVAMDSLAERDEFEPCRFIPFVNQNAFQLVTEESGAAERQLRIRSVKTCTSRP
jgi:hypothetical protein